MKPRFGMHDVSGYRNEEKIPTFKAYGISHRGVMLQSRYNKKEEIECMKGVVDGISETLVKKILSIWCDSKACATYSVKMREQLNEAACYTLSAAFLLLAGGHNGLTVVGSDGREWEGGPMWAGDD